MQISVQTLRERRKKSNQWEVTAVTLAGDEGEAQKNKSIILYPQVLETGWMHATQGHVGKHRPRSGGRRGMSEGRA